MKPQVFEALADAASSGEPVALGIIVGVRGSSPQKVGAKALFYADGRIRGTLGGGCLEAEIQQRAIQCLRSGHGAEFDLLLDHDFGWDDGLICGGKVYGVIVPNTQAVSAELWHKLARREASLEWGVRRNLTVAEIPPGAAAGDWLYRESVTPPCALWIAGAGHIGQAVAPLAHQLDFQVTVFDDRPALANHHYFPPEISLRAEVWEKLFAVPFPTAPAFGLIVTRGHRHDALVLKEWLRQPFVFLGMIGSSRKWHTIVDHFLTEKIATLGELNRVACPVGIRIRSQSVQEIAISIVAQFIDKRGELVHARKLPSSSNAELV